MLSFSLPFFRPMSAQTETFEFYMLCCASIKVLYTPVHHTIMRWLRKAFSVLNISFDSYAEIKIRLD